MDVLNWRVKHIWKEQKEADKLLSALGDKGISMDPVIRARELVGTDCKIHKEGDVHNKCVVSVCDYGIDNLMIR